MTAARSRARMAAMVFAGASLVYLIGTAQRTSFGVAAVDATARFDASAAGTSSVVVVQVAVYAALQIPVGVLADRWGPRPLLISGAALVAIGQALLAIAPDLWVALLARFIVGAGDAGTFVSVIRLLPAWFGPRLIPQLSQWVGVAGQFGQVVSIVPFAFLLHAVGWRPAFLIAGGASLLAVAIAVATIRRGVDPPSTGPIPVEGMGRRVLRAVRRPGTQLGFWAHLAAGAFPLVLALLWGYPFLTVALRLPLEVAAGLMTLLILGAVVVGPVIGLLVARFPFRRSSLVLGVVALAFGMWSMLLLWPGGPPLPVVAVALFCVGIGGPGSLIGFDLARSFNPSHAYGAASGIVNVGAFLGGFVAMFLIGLTLDLADAVRVAGGEPSALYSLEAFRIAFLPAYAIAAIGVGGLLHSRARVRRRMFEEEGIRIAPLWVALFRRRRGTAPRRSDA